MGKMAVPVTDADSAQGVAHEEAYMRAARPVGCVAFLPHPSKLLPKVTTLPQPQAGLQACCMVTATCCSVRLLCDNTCCGMTCVFVSTRMMLHDVFSADDITHFLIARSQQTGACCTVADIGLMLGLRSD